MKLTAREIASHKSPAGSSDYILWDEDIPGFGLRFRGAARTWIFQYAFGTSTNRVQRRLKIGKFSALPPGKARDVAADLHAKVHLGQDPAADKRKARSDASNTVGKLVDSYLAFKQTELRERSLNEVTRHLKVHAKPLHSLPSAAVDQRAIADRLSAIAKASGAVTANRVRSSISAMFAWAMGEGTVAANPVMNTNKREEKTRDRVLNDVELKIVWRSAGDDHYGAIVKLLILTAQRANEIAALERTEIDFERSLISLPGSRTKNGRAHDVPMASQVRAILESKDVEEGRRFIFGYGNGPFSGFSKSKEALDARIAKTNGKALEHWTLHDLRRTVATRMADIGIAPHIIEAVLNHVSGHKGGIAGIYNRALYTKEKADALVRWDEHVAAVVDNRASKIIPIKRA